jgi:hypothetical protein
MRHSVRYHDFYKEVNINQEYGTNMILKAIRTPKPPPDKPEAPVIVVDFGLKECILANKSVHSLSGSSKCYSHHNCSVVIIHQNLSVECQDIVDRKMCHHIVDKVL